MKPWLVANCDDGNQVPALLNPNCPVAVSGGLNINADYFVDPGSGYGIANNGSFIGQPIKLHQVLPTVSPGIPMPSLLESYFALDIPIDAASASCPATSSVNCGGLDPTSPGYPETIACANSKPIKCGDQVKIIRRPIGANPSLGVRVSFGYSFKSPIPMGSWNQLTIPASAAVQQEDDR